MSSMQRVSVGRIANRIPMGDDSDESLRLTLRDNRRKSRREKASDAGVWLSALFVAFVAWFMPGWFLGASLAIADGGGTGPTPSGRAAQIALLGLGSVATWFGLRACFTLAEAPRLGRGPHRAAMRWVPIVAGVLAAVFLHRFVYNGAAIASDFIAYAGAMAPALLMTEISWALPSISRGRYGTLIAAKGAIAWMAAGLALVAVGFMPSLWWMPAAFAVIGAACTTPAAVRIWRHYEGDVVAA